MELATYSKNVEIFAQITTADWQQFLEVAVRINLVTVGVLDSLGVKFADPVRW